jgi:ribosomal protein L37E
MSERQRHLLPAEIWYRFRCSACQFERQSRDRARIPDYCPACGYPKEQAGHVYRAEPRDGEDLDA